MLNNLIKFSIYNRGIVLFITLLVMILGAISFQYLPIDAVPDITNNQVQVNTTVTGLAPEEIERTITAPVEIAMRGIAGVIQVRSITRFGLSQVTIIFKDDVEIYRARQMVSERLQGVKDSLPKGAQTELGPISTGLGEIYQYVLDYKTPAKESNARLQQLIALKELQDWFVKPRLLTVEGVAEINTTGGFERQFHVQPDLKKMAKYGIHFDEIAEAIEKANQNVGGGYIEQTAEQFIVQAIGLFNEAKDIEDVPVKQLDNLTFIKVKDIALVTLDRELRTGSATFNGNESVLGTVMMLLGSNSRTVSMDIDKKVKELMKELPSEMELKVVYNRSDLVNATLSTVEHNLTVGAVLVILILFFLIGNARAAIITALTIPLSLLITFLVMKPLGLSGNLMSLGALDFGIIVDGTVILIDHCVHLITERTKEKGIPLTKSEIKEVLLEAAIGIRKSAGFGQLIIVVVFLPLFSLTGVEGKMFLPMAATFAIAITAALIISFTATPAFASLLFNSKIRDVEPKIMSGIRSLYEKSLDVAFRAPKLVLIISTAITLFGFYLFSKQGAEFLPQLGEGSFAFHMIKPVNTSLTHSINMQNKADEVLLTFPEVDHVFSRIGTSEVATDPMGVNVSDTYIMLKDRKKWPVNKNGDKHSYESLRAEMVSKLQSEVPGQNYLASQPIQMRFNELLEGTRADVAIKIFGPSLEKNIELAKEIKETVEGIKGAGDVEIDLSGTSPVLKIEPNREKIEKYGVSFPEIMDTVSTALSGKEAGYIYKEGRKYPIVVRLGSSDRSDLETINEIPVVVGPNTTIPLSSVSSIGFKENYSSITRENGERRSAVLINLRDRDTKSFVEEAKVAVEKRLTIPSGHYIEWGGNFKNLNEASKRLAIVAPIALAIVFFMVFGAFRNIPQTLMIFLGVPFSLVGGILNLILHDISFSISAGVGFIALSGIAVLNGVVLVNNFNERDPTEKITIPFIKKSASKRLRPVLMTALVASFGFLPMMFSTGVGAEVQKPLATVVVGGIVSSTFLTLIVLPIIFYQFYKKQINPIS